MLNILNGILLNVKMVRLTCKDRATRSIIWPQCIGNGEATRPGTLPGAPLSKWTLQSHHL